MSSRMRELSDKEAIAMTGNYSVFFEGCTDNRVLDYMSIISLSAFHRICNNRGLENPCHKAEAVVTICHHIEHELRDYINYEIELEYGPSEDEKNGLD